MTGYLVNGPIDKRGPVIIAGVGRFGQIVNRLLTANGYRTVVMRPRCSWSPSTSRTRPSNWCAT